MLRTEGNLNEEVQDMVNNYLAGLSKDDAPLIRVCVVGPKSSGKTTLIKNYINIKRSV